MESALILSTIERQQKIVRIIERQGRINVAKICEEFNISEATARRDLETLAGQGSVQRVHGGAIPVHRATPEMPILQRAGEQTEIKQRIGQAAAELVKDGETIFLGSGTTVLEVARSLLDRHDLTVITNSLPVMNLMAEQTHHTIVSLGGMLRPSELSFIGHLTEQSLAEVRVDKVIMGIHALSLEQGLTNDYLPETLTDRAILHSGRQVIIVADHTKCGSVSVAFLAPLTSIHILVTDSQTDIEFADSLTAQGIQVIVS
jgi:DeoR family transcriptional regulator of aga operon